MDYLAEVWLNGVRVGGHEGGETPFVLDVTEAVKPGVSNLLAVRVLNPDARAHRRDRACNETPQQARVIPYSAGAAYNHGGITGSVELLAVPPVRVEDLFVSADPEDGRHPDSGERASTPARRPRAASGVRAWPLPPAGETLQASVVGT